MNLSDIASAPSAYISPLNVPLTLQDSRPNDCVFAKSPVQNTDVFCRTLTIRNTIGFRSSRQWLRSFEGNRFINKTVFNLLQWHRHLSLCPEEKVAAIIFGYANEKIDLLSIGINGSPDDCLHQPLFVHKRGCEHAEDRALKQLPVNSGFYHLICYISLAPCLGCAEKIFRAGVEAIVYDREYRDRAGLEFLLNKGRSVYKLKSTGEMVPLNQDLRWQPLVSVRMVAGRCM